MVVATRQIIDLAQRPWARPREYQRFLGPFELDSTTGLYCAQESSSADRSTFADAFLKLPKQLADRCRQWDVTVSFWQGCTAAGNSSTFYGDFERQDRAGVSPHIEMSDKSLTPQLVLPHLTHEASHLWWRTILQSARDAYTAFLLDTCQVGCVEVTPYVHERFKQWLELLGTPDDGKPHVELQRLYAQKNWVEESFCDTVAVMHAPEYPHYNQRSTVNLEERQAAIQQLTGLCLK